MPVKPAILDRLRGVQRAGAGWLAYCPAHNDQHNRSLSVGVADDGKTLLKCHAAGCTAEQITAAVGMTLADLFDYSSNGAHSSRERLTLAAFAAAKHLPVDFLRQVGIEEDQRGLRITYRLADGQLAPRQRRRTAIVAKDGSTWDGARGTSPVPYGRWLLDQAREQGELTVCEGETSPLAAWYHNVPCLGIPGADMTKVLTAEDLEGIETLWIMRDPDRGGETFVAGLARRLDGLKWAGAAKVISLDGVKDLHELHVTASADFAARLDDARQRAVSLDVSAAAAPIPASGIEVGEDAVVDVEPATAAPYTFAPVVPAGHFLADYITYGASRTDAAHEYHEAAGLTLLAAATPNVRAELSPYPGGLGTNLYVLLVGDSTRSRKSTAAAIADDLHDAVIPGGRLAELTSPEALIEQLAARPADAATWFVDEMGDLLDKLHHAKHLAGLRGLLLTVYAGRDYRYARHSKRTKGGAKVEDADEIRAPHLSVFGATTPGVFDILTSADVRSGLLPRFAIVMPQAKPDRMPFYGGAGWGEARQAPLTAALHRLYVWAKAARRPVTFDAGALERLDAFAEALERAAGDHDESIRTMLHRLAPMALKVAMLLAAGQPTTPDRDGLMVSLSDAEAAVIIAGRWRADAVAFASRIGETEFERTVARCLRVFQAKTGAGKAVPRRAIAQNVHVSKRVLDDVEGTLQDRGEIHVSRIEIPGRPALSLWKLPGA